MVKMERGIKFMDKIKKNLTIVEKKSTKLKEQNKIKKWCKLRGT